MKNREILIKYLREYLDGKPKVIIGNYLLLGYDEITAFKKTMEYLRTKKRYTMLRRLQRILIYLNYYRKAGFQELFDKINGKSDRKFIKQRFVTYINCCDFDEWLDMEANIDIIGGDVNVE